MLADLDPISIPQYFSYILTHPLFHIQEYKDKGGQIAFPVGCQGFEDWLMDALEVPLVLEQINKRGKLDLIVMCSPSSTLNNSILSRLPSEKTSGGDYNNSGVNGFGGDGTQKRKALPHLQLPSMTINIDERDLQMTAFQIFLFSCPHASDDLLQAMRSQLEVMIKAIPPPLSCHYNDTLYIDISIK